MGVESISQDHTVIAIHNYPPIMSAPLPDSFKFGVDKVLKDHHITLKKTWIVWVDEGGLQVTLNSPWLFFFKLCSGEAFAGINKRFQLIPAKY